MATVPKRAPETKRPPSPTISIYQNPDHVAGILQQAVGQPLLTEASSEAHSDRSSNKDRGVKGGAEAEAKVGAPFLSELAGRLSMDMNRSSGATEAQGGKTTSNYIYSQAFYLYLLRQVLTTQGVIHTVTNAEDARGLVSGDFVEYQAEFRANEISSLLDILTPDLVAAIATHQQKALAIKGADPSVWTDFGARQAFLEQTKQRVEMKSELARAIAVAITVDFRTTKTREFYGRIGTAEQGAVTAITICDPSHFVGDDEDRILDGRFTVLGKVTEPVVENLPVLDRNKILDRLQPEWVDTMFDTLREATTAQASNVEGRLSSADSTPAEEIMDLALASRVEGQSFKVIPIAIYV